MSLLEKFLVLVFLLQKKKREGSQRCLSDIDMSVDEQFIYHFKKWNFYCENLASQNNLKILEEKMIGLKVMY
jgi:hypothetical protein